MCEARSSLRAERDEIRVAANSLVEDDLSWISAIPVPEFVTKDACVAVGATTFPRADGTTMQCTSIEDPLKATGLYGDVLGRASTDGLYVVGGTGGIATSTDHPLDPHPRTVAQPDRPSPRPSLAGRDPDRRPF